MRKPILVPSGPTTWPGPSLDTVPQSLSSGFTAPAAKSAPSATSVDASDSLFGTFFQGALTVFGDNRGNATEISSNAAGKILVDGGATPILGGTPTLINTKVINVLSFNGDDVITLNESNGALPRANIFAGAGNDQVTGGSGADEIFGQAGNDTLLGKGGADFLFGGAGNDTLTGGDGDDHMFGEAGNDRMIWNPGDDSDVMEGGAGTDTAEVNGAGGAEQFTIAANGSRVQFDRLDPAPFDIDIGTTENLVLNANGGDDVINATGNLAALIKLTIDGGAGNDTINAGNGNDLLLGGDGNDFIDGQQGNDVAFMGAGDDTFQWDPGDGSDIVEGQAGTDRMLFNGSNAAEIFALSANGGRAIFTRNVGNITMDNNDVERIDLNALGGADTVTLNDVSGTDVVEVNVDLAGTIGGTTGDGAQDTVIANATNGSDVIEVVGATGSASVIGLPALARIANAETNDSLVINALGGDDTISAATLPADALTLVIDGGAGNDTINGGAGRDVLLGGNGNDFIDGERGDDTAFLGAGDDVFRWDPGDGSDVVEGQDGTDTMLFNGAGAAEIFDMSANGDRLRFFRNLGNITMDTNDVEVVELNALGGADVVNVADLSATDVKSVEIDLAGVLNGTAGDGQLDEVAVSGSAAADVIEIHTTNGETVVAGLASHVQIANADANGTDKLTINGLGGDDVIDATALDANSVDLTLNGGLGADVFLGSDGDDFINGGDGDDVALMGAGDDVFVWNPGDDNDTIEGQAGFDTMLFNGANVAENVDISANGGRAIFFRNIANVTMDNNDVERLEFNALGGVDNIVVNDLSGTDVTEVALNLAAAGGVGDGANDTVTANGTAGDDVAVVIGDSTGVQVLGLAAGIQVTGAESGLDRIVIRALAGDDVIEASSVQAGAAGLLLDGGAGDDVLIGGAGDDVLLGGDGDDVLIGNAGDDVLDGGAGDDVIIGDPGDDIEIQGFVTGAGSEDRLDLTAFDITFDWLMANTSDVDGNAVLDLGDQQITLRGVSASALHQDDILV